MLKFLIDNLDERVLLISLRDEEESAKQTLAEILKNQLSDKGSKWNDVAGVVERDTGYYYELQGVVEDAVECGVQAACGIMQPLDGEPEKTKNHEDGDFSYFCDNPYCRCRQ